MEGMPLRLLVSSIVVALTMPAIVNGFQAFESAQAASRAEREIDRIVRAAQDFYASGGGAEVLAIDLSGGLTAKVEYVAVGDSAGSPRSSTATYKVSGEAERVLLTKPPVPMEGPNGPLVLGAGAIAVRVSYDGEGPVRLAIA